jgi:hypothetical protein
MKVIDWLARNQSEVWPQELALRSINTNVEN